MTSSKYPCLWNILGANRGGNTSVFVTGSIAAHEGTKGLTLKTTDAYDAVAFAILPQIETGNEMVFYYKSNYSKKPLEVGYLTDPADSTTWHRIAEYKGTSTWTRVILTLACGRMSDNRTTVSDMRLTISTQAGIY